jgi:cysteine desulfurase
MYFDYNATHPICHEVLNNIADILSIEGNPSSAHQVGRTAKDAVEAARECIADFLDVSYKELIFTSGGTESNVLAILGYCRGNLSEGDKILYCGLEHPSLLGAIGQLNIEGFNCVKLSVDSSGMINMDELMSNIVDAKLLTMMFVNNETGSINPVRQIGEICQIHKVVFHCDCVQALMKTSIDLSTIDLASFSGHKIGALKGIGFLYKKSSLKLSSLFPKSTQEKGVRGGTENVSGILSIATALRAECNLDFVKTLRDYFEDELLKRFRDVEISCYQESRVCNTSSVHFPNCSGESLIFSLDMKGICVSLGSACAAGSISPSHVLQEMGFDDQKAKSTVRFSFGKYNTKQEVEVLLQNLEQIIARVKR